MCGQPPVKGGKIVQRFFPMRKFTTLSRNPGQETAYRALMSKLNAAHGSSQENIKHINDLGRLLTMVGQEVKDWFPGSEVSFQGSPSSSPIEKAASASKRLIYIPSRTTDTIYVSGNTGSDSITMFSAIPPQLGLTNLDFNPDAGCLVICPMLSGDGNPDFEVQGLMLVTRTAPEAFDPLVDLPILRMLANDTAIVMAQSELTL